MFLLQVHDVCLHFMFAAILQALGSCTVAPTMGKGDLGKAWAKCRKSKGRMSRDSLWLKLDPESQTMGMEDLRNNVPFVHRAITVAPEICNAPKKIEKEEP